MRHEDGDLALVLDQRLGDLLGGEHQAAGRVQDDVDRLLGRRQANRAQHRLRVVDADARGHRHAEDAGAFLTVDHGDDARLARLLELPEERAALLVDVATAEHLDQYNEEQREPECSAREIGDVQGPGTLFFFHLS